MPFGTAEGAKALASAAEDTGIESVWTVEHACLPAGYQSVYPYSPDGRMVGDIKAPLVDSFIWLAYMAAVTTNLRLATGVAILPQRNVVYTAKEIASLDHLSGGRVILGVGSGWNREEFGAVGVPFDRRGARLDEYIRALRVLWTEDEPTFAGEFVQLDRAICRPQPAQGSVPIVIGGHTERAARRAGELGDGFFPGTADQDLLERLIAVMRRSAEDAGRDPAAIEVTAFGATDPAGIDHLRSLGVSRTMVPPMAFDPVSIRGALEDFAENVIQKAA
ncbi:MAG TPA: LLM class F420-dependent oxidoreductase [Iamia sp.]|nr:LLM class F420-dependent oxidoreductase [Iamia sp.]